MNTANDNAIAEVLAFDPLHAAEDITGKSYKESQATMSLGLLMHMDSGARKRALLKESNDTHYNVSWDDFLMYLELEGFTVGHTEEFQGRYGTEEFILATSSRGLVEAESFTWTGQPRKLNNASLYFNYHVHDDLYLAASGHYNRDELDKGQKVWVGHKDLREGMRHTFRVWERAGHFITPWVETPWLWLLNYTDTDGDTWKNGSHEEHMVVVNALNAKRLAALPSSARHLLGI